MNVKSDEIGFNHSAGKTRTSEIRKEIRRLHLIRTPHWGCLTFIAMFGPSSALVFLPQSGQVRNLATLKDITVQLRSSKNIQNVKKLKLKMAAEAAEAGTGALALYETADIKAPEGKTSKHLLVGVTTDRHHPLCTITNRIPNQTVAAKRWNKLRCPAGKHITLNWGVFYLGAKHQDDGKWSWVWPSLTTGRPSSSRSSLRSSLEPLPQTDVDFVSESSAKNRFVLLFIKIYRKINQKSK